MSDVLVLSQAWEPVDRVSWQRALTLYFQDKVEIVEQYEDRHVRSITVSLKMPSIIRFLKAVRGRKRAVKFSRENVFARDGGMCQYQAAPGCPRKLTRAEATYDHVVPRASGGKTTWENIVICCVPCNQQKRNRTPEQAGMALRKKPVRPRTLPDMRITVSWNKDMPQSWGAFFRDLRYWNGALDSD